MNSSAVPAKRQVLLSICFAALILPLSFSGGAVATPAIGRDLGGTPAALTWVTNAFMLSFGSCLMAAGTLADTFGRKRVFLSGVALFVVVSICLGLAPSVLSLDLLRAAQGIAAAAALSGGTAALAQEFDGRSRTRAFSLLGTTFGVGLAFGPLLAGALIETLGWRAVFMSSAVVGTLALVLGTPRLRESRDPDATGLDWPGTITFTATLSLFTFGVIQAPASGWTSPTVIALLAGAAVLLAAFIVIETRIARPMLDLSLFRIPRFVGVQVLPMATTCCYVILLVLLPLRFIGIEGYSEIDAGWLMIWLSAPMLIVPFTAATLTRWLSAGLVSAVGLCIAACGLLWLSRVAAGADAVVLPLLLIGLGTAMPWGLMDGLSVSVVPTERAGMATGIFSTTRVAGEGVVLAIVAAVLASLSQTGLHTALPPSTPGVAARIAEAAQRIATGDLHHAAAILPEVSRPMLVQTYVDAFAVLLWVLAGITVASAFAVAGFLRRPRPSTTVLPNAVAETSPTA